jgi:mannose-6-phosphate isomerase-like protein (cupin superfamily)
MKRRINLGLVFCVLLSASLAQQTTSPAPIETSERALATPYSDVPWKKLLPELGDRSPEIAILHIDPTTKATELLIRSTAAIHVPMHWHSANETHTVIRGTIVFEHGGQYDRLAPGGFNYIPKKMHHQAWLPANAVVFITVDGAWDTNWVQGPPTKADFGKGAVPPSPKEK